MPTYRLCFIDVRSGRIGRVVDLDARDDEEAIRLAGAQDGAEAMELREGSRKICRFEARPVPIARPLA